MKTLFTLLWITLSVGAIAQLPVSIYEAPASGNKMDRFEHDDNFLYAVRDSSVDKIDAVSNTAVKLFDKPWGASLNASGKAIFSNGKAIIGQYIPGSPYRYKYWVYDGTTFDTLFSLVNTQIDNWVIDGNVCYFYVGVNKALYKSNFTRTGTTVINRFSSNTLLVSLQMFNHDLYFFNTTSATNNNVLKKYASNILTTIDSSYNYALGDFKMQVYNNELFLSHYQFIVSPSARYASKITKLNSSGASTILYSDTTASAVYVKGFMGGLAGTIFMDASIGATSNEYIYKMNSASSNTPALLQNNSGSSLKPQSAPMFKQGSGMIYMDIYDPSNVSSGNRDLWQTDGTANGTVMVAAPTATNITHASGFSLGNVDQWCLQGVTCDNTLYSILNYGELWVEDGTTAPTKINVPNYITFGNLATCGGSIFMTSQNATTYKKQIMKLGCASSTGFNNAETQEARFSVYPNPSENLVNIKRNSASGNNEMIYIYTILGEQVMMVNMDAASELTTINIGSLVSGTYIISMGNGENTLLIKQ